MQSGEHANETWTDKKMNMHDYFIKQTKYAFCRLEQKGMQGLIDI